MDADAMLKLHDYQEKAVDFLYEHDHCLLLATVGAGKTAAALTLMREMYRDGHAKRWLVLAPKRVAQHTWPTELELWAPELKMSVAIGTPKERLIALDAPTQIVVTNYDNLQWLATLKDAMNFDGIIFDELTKLKNPSGKRFKALQTFADKMKFRYGLTGSFTSNGLEDVFGQCKAVDEKLLGRSKGAFLQQYFVCLNRQFQDWAPRKGALDQVMDRIRPAAFILENKEYKDGLPPLRTVELRCDMPDRQPYEDMKKHFVVEFPDAKAVAANAAVVTGKLQQMSSGFVYETTSVPNPDKPGKFITTKKPVWFSDHKFELLDDLLEENQHASTIIFYNFQEELAELKRRYPHLKTLDDDDVVNRWNAGKVELLVAHPQSAQFGLNLQGGGNKIVWLSLPWSLTDYEQAIGRLHRQGQKYEVWNYVLLVNNSIDEKVWAALDDKKAFSEIAMEALK